MTPILLDSTAGCPGTRDAIRGRAAAICHLCSRFGEPSPHIKPQAKRISGGEWFCPNRRSGGEVVAVHEEDCAPFGMDSEALRCGGGVANSDGNGGVR